MAPEFEVCIVIPCFNESFRFRFDEFETYLHSNTAVLLCFVDDGSSDTTLEVLTELKKRCESQVTIVSYKKNSGKAHAVREGVLHCQQNFNFKAVAYLDADLSVSLQECYEMSKLLGEKISFCFGSRIAKIGSTIERKRSRFLIGRVIATIISISLSLKVYDTQCGCKVFLKPLSEKLFAQPFISKWLFDVEIFFRMMGLYGREVAVSKMLEQPLLVWKDQGDSKVKITYFFKLWIDLYKIKSAYKKV